MYSLVDRTCNGADEQFDSPSLLGFAAKKSLHHLVTNLSAAGPEGPDDPFASFVFLGKAIGTPAVFGYYLLTGPFLYKKQERN